MGYKVLPFDTTALQLQQSEGLGGARGATGELLPLLKQKDDELGLLLGLGDDDEDGPLSDVIGLGLVASPPMAQFCTANLGDGGSVMAEGILLKGGENVGGPARQRKSTKMEERSCLEEAQAALGLLSEAGVIR